MKPINHPIRESSNYLESTFGQSFELKKSSFECEKQESSTSPNNKMKMNEADEDERTTLRGSNDSLTQFYAGNGNVGSTRKSKFNVTKV